MNMIDLDQLNEIRQGQKASEERYNRDRRMYLQGREGYPESPAEGLSDRDRGCYMMGFKTSETLQQF